MLDFYVDRVIQSGLSIEDAVKQAKALSEQRRGSGFDQAALDNAAWLGFAAGVFEDGEADGVSVIEKFCPVINGSQTGIKTETKPVALPAGRPGLQAKLATRHVATTGAAP